MLHEGTV
jgi:hypothetical protein